jgi:hypothetical protein
MSPLSLLSLAGAGLNGLALLWVFERRGGPLVPARGVVTGRRRTAAGHVPVLIGKVPVPLPAPARFEFEVHGPAGPVRVATDAATYARVADGEEVGYVQRRGRFTQRLYAARTRS